MQHGSSSASAMGASAAAGGASASSRHRNERGERSLPSDRTFPPNASQRPPQSSNSNGPMPSRNSSSNAGPNIGSNSSMPPVRTQSMAQSLQQVRQSGSSSSSSMPNKMDQRHMSKEHKSHPDKNLAMKHNLSSKSATQPHFNAPR